MKKIRLPLISLTLLTAVAVWALFIGYGNKKNHPTLNTFIVKAFLAKNNKEGFSMKKFKHYEFKLDKAKLRGNYINRSGLFNPIEIDRFHEDVAAWFYGEAIYSEEAGDKTPVDWIAHGGYSADVPEVPASFRHFYDPTRPAGKKHLTDDVNSKLMKWLQSHFTNPETDGVTWAIGQAGSLGALEHNYSWENGKVFMKGALEEKDPNKRNAYMAKAWRSLGETLHMIADNGCPAHVRNDAHPSVPMRVMSYFGNPDTYEEMMDEFQTNNDAGLDEFQSGKVDSDLALSFEKSKNIKELAHKLAVFTNENFFTGETISGTDWKGNVVKPITHPDYVYASPKISEANYSNNYYRRNIGSREVLLCTDTWFFNKYPISKTVLHLDEDCVKSQAAALVPAIKEAGLNAMRLFIPDLSVKITSLSDDGSITGEIIHNTDEEYTKAIKYNGPVVIKTATLDQLGKFEAKNGRFSGRISPVDNTWIYAEIEFGGVFVKSEQKKMNNSPVKPPTDTRDYNTLEFVFYAYLSYTINGYKNGNQMWYKNGYNSVELSRAIVITKGNLFSGRITDTEGREGWVKGEYNSQKLLWFKAHFHFTDYKNGTKDSEEWIDVEVRNIPIDEEQNYSRRGWDCDNLRPDPEFQKSIVRMEHKVKFFPSGQEISIDHIDYNHSEIERCKNWLNPNSIFIPCSFFRLMIHEY